MSYYSWTGKPRFCNSGARQIPNNNFALYLLPARLPLLTHTLKWDSNILRSLQINSSNAPTTRDLQFPLKSNLDNAVSGTSEDLVNCFQNAVYTVRVPSSRISIRQLEKIATKGYTVKCIANILVVPTPFFLLHSISIVLSICKIHFRIFSCNLSSAADNP